MENHASQQLSPMDMEIFERLVRELILLRDQKATIATHEKELRESIPPYLEVIGEATGPSGQHRTYTLDEPIRGVKRVVWQTKVSQTVDEEQAEAIARTKGIFDSLFVMTPVLSEEAVMVALDEGVLSEEDLAKIFPRKISHALVLEKK